MPTFGRKMKIHLKGHDNDDKFFSSNFCHDFAPLEPSFLFRLDFFWNLTASSRNYARFCGAVYGGESTLLVISGKCNCVSKLLLAGVEVPRIF